MKVNFFSIEITFFSSLSILFQVLIQKTLKEELATIFIEAFGKVFSIVRERYTNRLK